jgi:hypothetical protein
VACLERLRSSGIDIRQYDNSDIADDVRDFAFASSCRGSRCGRYIAARRQ